MELKTCPNCERKVLSLITDNASGKRYCYNCIPNPESCPGAVFVARKMDVLHAAGKLESYTVEQRLKDLNDPPRCECGAVLDVVDGKLCSKCKAEATTEEAAKNEKGRIEGDVGPALLDFVFKEMQIDTQWSVRDGRTLTWWGHQQAQRIWAEPVRLDGGDEIVRVHARTDVLRNVPDDPRTAKGLSALNMNASLSAYVWDRKSRRVALQCSAYFHTQNIAWLRRFFVSAVAIQAAEAHIQPDTIAKLIGGEPDLSSHPKNGARLTMDEMLDIIAVLFAPQGSGTSAFTSADFEAVMRLSPAPWVMANASDDGLTAEFPFPGCMPPTALLTATNSGRHPRFGSGLLVLLKLPLGSEGMDLQALAHKLNAAEMSDWTRCHFMGAWCVDPDQNVPTYCCFFPSALRNPGLLENCVYSIAHRVRWANDYSLVSGRSP